MMGVIRSLCGNELIYNCDNVSNFVVFIAMLAACVGDFASETFCEDQSRFLILYHIYSVSCYRQKS